MTAGEFYDMLSRSLRNRKDIDIKKFKLRYRRKGNYDFLRIGSKEIGREDKVILIRAGIHGDEVAGPLTILFFCNEIINYIHKAGLKFVIYPLGNPCGFELNERYVWKRHDGNNDFLRYEVEKGGKIEIAGDLGTVQEYKKWYWCSDQKLKIRLPRETGLMHKLLKEDPLSQISAVIDLHQDYKSDFSAMPYAYHYAFGDLAYYQSIVKKIEEIVPILRNTDVEAGESCPEKSDDCGFIIRHDGTLPDLMFRLGTKHCITPETTGATPIGIACEVNLIWIFGITDLVKEGI